ncbi:MAG: sigma-54-dependent Fis family transcriptional regulator [Proteobacteria bacterium]|nr:sigma-54-dependent Fis family transcriptional regulator [Pseudomonadota bacterium]
MTVADTPRHRGRILIVDDETNLVKTFRYCLEDAGYGVSSARNTAEATALVQGWATNPAWNSSRSCATWRRG